jgi:uncharacterized protein
MPRNWALIGVLLCAASPAASQPKNRTCSTDCAVELLNGCCPAVPDPSPVPSGGCSSTLACAKECLSGDGLSCTRAGQLSHQPGAGDERDDARATVFFDRACRLRDGRGCALGKRASRAGYAATPYFEAAVTKDEIACQRGDGPACSKLSELHWEDEKYPLYADRACRLGVHNDCAMLAEALLHTPRQYFAWGSRHGVGMQGRGAEFPGAFERACVLAHHMTSCLNLASWSFHEARPGLSPEQAVEAQWKAAFERLDPLCKQGKPQACKLLGELNDELLDHSPRPRTYDKTLGPRLFAEACDSSDAKACTALGVALVRGRGVAADRTAAAKVLRKACDLRDGNACVVLSQITEDPRRARSLIQEACEKGMRGPTGGIFRNVGLPEYPQPYGCNRPLPRSSH